MRQTILGFLLAGGIALPFQAALADDDGWFGFGKRRPDVAPVNNTLYAQECGACHFAYQPGLLPARSWQKLMAGLEDHFGENAELDAEEVRRITAYLVENAADRSDYKRSRKMARSIPAGAAPLRITEVPYFRREHSEIPKRVVSGNPKVGSLSNCDACHTRAQDGSFEEGEINIPGYGRWED